MGLWFGRGGASIRVGRGDTGPDRWDAVKSEAGFWTFLDVSGLGGEQNL